MHAIILAAGTGSRLAAFARGVPKCLLPVHGDSLLERQLGALRAVGIARVTIVVGFAADAVRAACSGECRFIENVDFASTNSLYSLWLARESLRDGAIVMNSDVLFHAQLLHDLVETRHDTALLVAYRQPGDPPFGDEEMKVTVRHGQVAAISKQIPRREAHGENLGIVRVGPSGAPQLVPILEELIAAGAHQDWAPRAFAEYARTNALHAIGTRGLPWIEIDSPEDYQRAIEEIAPRIAATDGTLSIPATVRRLRRGA